jgi:hypothetical protein
LFDREENATSFIRPDLRGWPTILHPVIAHRALGQSSVSCPTVRHRQPLIQDKERL